MQYVSKAIEEALGMVDEQGQEVDWEDLADIIQTIHMEKDWSEQYHNAVRLQARIRLYDQFSWNMTGWHRWFFEHLGSLPRLKVLELGCGDSALWRRNANLIPKTEQIRFEDYMLIDDVQLLIQYITSTPIFWRVSA